MKSPNSAVEQSDAEEIYGEIEDFWSSFLRCEIFIHPNLHVIGRTVNLKFSKEIEIAMTSLDYLTFVRSYKLVQLKWQKTSPVNSAKISRLTWGSAGSLGRAQLQQHVTYFYALYRSWDEKKFGYGDYDVGVVPHWRAGWLDVLLSICFSFSSVSFHMLLRWLVCTWKDSESLIAFRHNLWVGEGQIGIFTSLRWGAPAAQVRWKTPRRWKSSLCYEQSTLLDANVCAFSVSSRSVAWLIVCKVQLCWFA